jgi:hypothetical protein
MRIAILTPALDNLWSRIRHSRNIDVVEHCCMDVVGITVDEISEMLIWAVGDET